MGLKRMGAGALLLLTVLGAAWQAQADFAAAEGFSGRTGFDCTTCHIQPHPTAPPARAVLEGIPDAWRPGASYLLTVRVEGGPPALPAPAPQGGFELDAEGGRLRPAPGFEDLLRTPGPHTIDYEPPGTLMRTWEVVWEAPGLDRDPSPLRLWLAVLAADGNHVVLTNTSDAGEKFDMVDTLVATVPVHPDARAQWEAIPLRAPVVDAVEASSSGTRIRGHQDDANATHVAYRIGDGPWQTRAAAGSWRIEVQGLPPGEPLELRAEGARRVSPVVTAAVGDTDGNARSPTCQGGGCPEEPTPSPAAAAPLILLTLAHIARRRPSPCNEGP